MARYPGAIWHPRKSAGAFTGGPWKIVHHTTECSSIMGAISELERKHVESHFVVDDKNVWQLIDTSEAAKALRNAPGGVQTNKDEAIQIETVGFAGKPKNPATLANLRKLLIWLEQTHLIPPVWPNGYPKPAVNGHDPGGHNRNAHNWDTKGGHYGHCHVPENIHWDPAYTKEECDFLMVREATNVEVGKTDSVVPAV